MGPRFFCRYKKICQSYETAGVFYAIVGKKHKKSKSKSKKGKAKKNKKKAKKENQIKMNKLFKLHIFLFNLI